MDHLGVLSNWSLLFRRSGVGGGICVLNKLQGDVWCCWNADHTTRNKALCDILHCEFKSYDMSCWFQKIMRSDSDCKFIFWEIRFVSLPTMVMKINCFFLCIIWANTSTPLTAVFIELLFSVKTPALVTLKG